MKAYSSRELIKIIKNDGWYETHCVGSHPQFKHPTKKERSQYPIQLKASIKQQLKAF